jgi:hypothetical protein
VSSISHRLKLFLIFGWIAAFIGSLALQQLNHDLGIMIMGLLMLPLILVAIFSIGMNRGS